MTLTILAVSRQGHGFSVIGYSAGKFVRLINPTPDGILVPRSFRIWGRQRPRVWDVLDVDAPYTDSRPTQPENRILGDRRWRLLQRPAHEWRIPLSTEPEIFGSRDAAIRAPLASVDASILCIEPSAAVAVCAWREDQERFQARVQFSYSGSVYNLPLTDATWAPRLVAKGEGEHSFDAIGCRVPHGVRLILSLGEPWRGFCYKTVAGILPNRRATLWPDGTTTTLSDATWRAADGPLERADSAARGA